ncbi:Monooxygenase 1 [Camellia lanceoleosa]|uniref:Monooxygenase 1 n=1 Tax=Camellia lanceoleosa TaxID=1840588 RepID=A0ACC0GQ52_9ERIC|nr:Monooxygenase 1 [Camellia lanceoleosa]
MAQLSSFKALTVFLVIAIFSVIGSSASLDLPNCALCCLHNPSHPDSPDLSPSLLSSIPSIVGVKLDPLTSYPILQLLDGRCIVAKALIGCDGANSVVADFLELKPPKAFPLFAVRGLTKYPSGHAFAHEFVRMRRNNIMVGRVPIDDKSVNWMVGQQSTPKDARALQNPDLIRQSTLPLIAGFPLEIQQMIEDSDVESLSLTHVRYCAPWDLLLGKFRKGTVTVAGDAMHVMCPFLGQDRTPVDVLQYGAWLRIDTFKAKGTRRNVSIDKSVGVRPSVGQGTQMRMVSEPVHRGEGLRVLQPRAPIDVVIDGSLGSNRTRWKDSATRD